MSQDTDTENSKLDILTNITQLMNILLQNKLNIL